MRCINLFVHVLYNACLFVLDHDIPRGDVHQQVWSHLIQSRYVFTPIACFRHQPGETRWKIVVLPSASAVLTKKVVTTASAKQHTLEHVCILIYASS